MSYTFNPLEGTFDYYKDVIDTGSSLPSSGATGKLFYLTTTSTLYIYFGGWVSIGSGTPPATPSLIPFGLVYIPQ